MRRVRIYYKSCLMPEHFIGRRSRIDKCLILQTDIKMVPALVAIAVHLRKTCPTRAMYQCQCSDKRLVVPRASPQAGSMLQRQGSTAWPHVVIVQPHLWEGWCAECKR